LDADGRPETDLLQIRNIDGLDPVKAAINSTPMASGDGVAFTGSNVIVARNIVLTIRPNPDWKDWTHDTLRKLLYLYFVPKKPIDLVFESDDLDPVRISGYTESISNNPFTQDPEYQVSIICPDPYFASLNPIVVSGTTSTDGSATFMIPYNGTVETGIEVKITKGPAGGGGDTLVEIHSYSSNTYVSAMCVLLDTEYFIMSSIPGHKFVQNVVVGPGTIIDLIPSTGLPWPTLAPGPSFCAITTYNMFVGALEENEYTLTYSERFDGL
jgi:hypothetical protein